MLSLHEVCANSAGWLISAATCSHYSFSKCCEKRNWSSSMIFSRLHSDQRSYWNENKVKWETLSLSLRFYVEARAGFSTIGITKTQMWTSAAPRLPASPRVVLLSKPAVGKQCEGERYRQPEETTSSSGHQRSVKCQSFPPELRLCGTGSRSTLHRFYFLPLFKISFVCYLNTVTVPGKTKSLRNLLWVVCADKGPVLQTV